MDPITSSVMREILLEHCDSIRKYIDINTKYLYNSLKLLPKEIEINMSFKLDILNQRIDDIHKSVTKIENEIKSIQEESKRKELD